MSASSLFFFGCSVGLRHFCSRIRCWLQFQYHRFCLYLQYYPTNSTSPEEMPENNLQKCHSKIVTRFYSLYTSYFTRSEFLSMFQICSCLCFLFKIHVHSSYFFRNTALEPENFIFLTVKEESSYFFATGTCLKNHLEN